MLQPGRCFRVHFRPLTAPRLGRRQRRASNWLTVVDERVDAMSASSIMVVLGCGVVCSEEWIFQRGNGWIRNTLPAGPVAEIFLDNISD